MPLAMGKGDRLHPACPQFLHSTHTHPHPLGRRLLEPTREEEKVQSHQAETQMGITTHPHVKTTTTSHVLWRQKGEGRTLGRAPAHAAAERKRLVCSHSGLLLQLSWYLSMLWHRLKRAVGFGLPACLPACMTARGKRLGDDIRLWWSRLSLPRTPKGTNLVSGCPMSPNSSGQP